MGSDRQNSVLNSRWPSPTPLLSAEIGQCRQPHIILHMPFSSRCWSRVAVSVNTLSVEQAVFTSLKCNRSDCLREKNFFRAWLAQQIRWCEFPVVMFHQLTRRAWLIKEWKVNRRKKKQTEPHFTHVPLTWLQFDALEPYKERTVNAFLKNLFWSSTMSLVNHEKRDWQFHLHWFHLKLWLLKENCKSEKSISMQLNLKTRPSRNSPSGHQMSTCLPI